MSTHEDRYLIARGDPPRFYYNRRIPELVLPQVRATEGRPKLTHVRMSLKTTDLAEARRKRDHLETADDAYWASLVTNPESARARHRYERARTLAVAFGFQYREAAEIAERETIDEINNRIEAVEAAVSSGVSEKRAVEALLGTVSVPGDTLATVRDEYLNVIAADARRTKDAAQYEVWRRTRERAMAVAIEVIGEDREVKSLTRADGLALQAYWRRRVDAGELRAASAEKAINTVSAIWRKWHEYRGDEDRENIFRKLNLTRGGAATKAAGKRAKYPPFSREWIIDRILQRDAMTGLNTQGCAIIMMMIETGARESEIVNLLPEHIRLTDPAPHISIEFTDQREIKSASSQRVIPLVGVALEAAKAFPNGFSRYRGKRTFSAAGNKWLRTNGLRETGRHVLYSLRHAFKDRMIAAGVDEELREVLMGHEVGHIVYGRQGSLRDRQAALQRVALPVPDWVSEVLTRDRTP